MTPNQYLWAQARNRLVAAVTAQGFSAELAEPMAKQLAQRQKWNPDEETDK